ncbi:hypothetical protein H696_01188 [Fonticula alba]|uniref:NADH dehydrogenase [ubiquinone] 1 alpha subcomplex subunit 12 n=1 Tax=Fonticula alba TaxID=691883 RepID=A0A058ZBH1_FONAL|nr:hypothetical protein H696_01188 [Fonticula alba]KCV71770.1 hypothetical protein H696_01188 [Fonticula alba]|eukprot:XP_009493348.1 hypothetical protein H696_01188 [Fonticula alba]
MLRRLAALVPGKALPPGTTPASGGNVFSRSAQSALTALKEMVDGKDTHLVGTDQYGNEYYESPPPNPPGRPRRKVVPKGMNPRDVYLYESGSLPVQWHSWLTHRRAVPPTLEEIARDEQRRLDIQERARLIDQHWREVKAQGTISLGFTPEAVAAREARAQAAAPPPVSSPEYDPILPVKELVTSQSLPSETYQPEAWTPGKPNKQ